MAVDARVEWVDYPDSEHPALTRHSGVITSAFDLAGMPLLLRESDGRRLTPSEMKGIRLRLVGALTPNIRAMLQESGFYVVWSESRSAG
jgi:hypothetical protein